MKKIKLNTGGYALVDNEDFTILNQYNWTLGKDGYAFRTIVLSGKGKLRKRRSLRMHEAILVAQDGFITDHINRNRLDNRRLNLRKATFTTNAINKNKQSNNASGVTGVSWHKTAKKWTASIWVNKKQIYLGLFNNIQAARIKRIQAEEKYFSNI